MREELSERLGLSEARVQVIAVVVVVVVMVVEVVKEAEVLLVS